MADIKREDVLKYLENSNMLEISELISEIEEKFGVSAAAPVAVAAAPGADAGGAAAEEKSEFDVILASVPGDKKIAVIKAIREVKAGLGLADAKKVAEGAPAPLLEGVSKEEAEEAKKKLEAAGATAELK